MHINIRRFLITSTILVLCVLTAMTCALPSMALPASVETTALSNQGAIYGAQELLDTYQTSIEDDIQMDLPTESDETETITDEDEVAVSGIIMDKDGDMWYMPYAIPLTFLSQEEIDSIKKYNLYTLVEDDLTDTRENREIIWDYWYYKTGNAYGVAGLMGNMWTESGFIANNVQGSFERKHGWTDATYTAAVDNGTYTNFAKDGAGYGLVQWTYWTYKQEMLDYIHARGQSIGSIYAQLDYLYYQFTGKFSNVGNDIFNATSIRFASDAVMLKFERPANQSEAARVKRANHGQDMFDACSSRCPQLDVIKTFIQSEISNAEGRAKALEMQLQFNMLFSEIKSNVHTDIIPDIIEE